MSRIGKNPIAIPAGVDIKLDGDQLKIKGKNGELSLSMHPEKVGVSQKDGQLVFETLDESREANALSGTLRALAANMVKGVTDGFERKLQLVGVGYRAQAQGKNLNLSLGFSHPVVYEMPEGVSVQTPSQTEIVLTGSDKQKVGQVAAEIRAFRPPEPYKGKGVRYQDETIILKETKKK